MKRLNVFISEEAHEIIQRYQKEHGISTRDEATDKYILETEQARLHESHS